MWMCGEAIMKNAIFYLKFTQTAPPARIYQRAIEGESNLGTFLRWNSLWQFPQFPHEYTIFFITKLKMVYKGVPGSLLDLDVQVCYLICPLTIDLLFKNIQVILLIMMCVCSNEQYNQVFATIQFQSVLLLKPCAPKNWIQSLQVYWVLVSVEDLVIQQIL